MGESALLTEWKHVAHDLGIAVEGPFDLMLPSGACVRAPVLVHHFGGPKGMLVLTNSTVAEKWTDEIVRAGYGFSVMDEPSSSGDYARDVCIEVLEDWGWFGPEPEKPAWLKH